jgi:hypothetical protein
MKLRSGITAIVAGLLAASALLYVLLYVLFGNAHDIEFYLLFNIAFLPIQVVLVALILERLLARHELHQRLHKMNMVIGTFFTELGTQLLGELTASLANRDAVVAALNVRAGWTPEDFHRALKHVAGADFRFDPAQLDLAALHRRLAAKRDFIVLLLANPNLLEHERFTDLLWAVSHLAEELAARPSLEGLPDKDREHLAGDVKRVYTHLAGEWLRYCRHLQQAYPYIFSIVVRTHPLQARPCATVV